ncbi:alpha-beta hydrolase superfamily lysophospholipase [Prosthecobacter fusiformis]|uniref:Alpha-beta hydrolase superfamily lysophospholipase n=1 Tax=Prosthecobacter fusiformis TaxID=48464 RepID=A0A4R7RMC9_9BACT|nr:alpha/beta fold hydrolase [Prosthecobacter fusiformis]TDU64653.1 alpha-beta hydrolase superfamily lysophospholipase [Prosthecobacter fusiformis]
MHTPTISSSSQSSDSQDDRRELVRFSSLGVDIYAYFIPAATGTVSPVLIVSHGAGEFKENYLEMAGHLSKRGISCLLLDMHGHGASGGHPYHVRIKDWVADLQAAIDYLVTRKDVDPQKIGAFGLSSGGTAILEAAVIEPRLRALVALDATVMNTLPWSITLSMGSLSFLGYLKRLITGKDLRISIVQLLEEVELASDPEINARLRVDPGKIRAFQNFPLPGAAAAFFVNTIRRVDQIKAATLVIWGEDDHLDPVSTAHKLHQTLTCTKGLEIVKGNGHAGHLDRNRLRVFDLTADWLIKHMD